MFTDFYSINQVRAMKEHVKPTVDRWVEFAEGLTVLRWDNPRGTWWASSTSESYAYLKEYEWEYATISFSKEGITLMLWAEGRTDRRSSPTMLTAFYQPTEESQLRFLGLSSNG